jgi:uncharacterized membrane protein YcaP (DUF421 family)
MEAMVDGKIFFDDWEGLIRTGVIILFAYPGMLLMVRLSGHRTLAQLNAFDFIVTVALGSTLASVITAKDVALAQGLLAFALLILGQFTLALLASRSQRVERVLNGDPVLLAHRGRMLRSAMRSARIADEEIHAVLRGANLPGMADVEAVILETNGHISVVKKTDGDDRSALDAVPRYHDSTSAMTE